MAPSGYLSSVLNKFRDRQGMTDAHLAEWLGYKVTDL